jgi:hypothetical protein
MIDIFLDKEYEEIAALKVAEDEGKRIQVTRQRHQQLRQLFFKQARTNRVKVNDSFRSLFCSISFQYSFIVSRMGSSTY